MCRLRSGRTRLLTHSLESHRHPWSHVVIGMWHKYPNPHCSHVVTIDVLDRTVDPKTGVIRTERVLGCKQKAPTWIVKVCTSVLSYPLLHSLLTCVYSSLVALKTLSFAKSRSLTLRHKRPLSHRSTSPSRSSRRVTKTSGTCLHLMDGRRSSKRQRSRRGWHFGGARRTSWRTGWCRDLSRTHSSGRLDSRTC